MPITIIPPPVKPLPLKQSFANEVKALSTDPADVLDMNRLVSQGYLTVSELAKYVNDIETADYWARIFNSQDDQLIDGILADNNLAETRAEDIWHSTYLHSDKKSTLQPVLSPIAISKALYFGEEATWKTSASPSTYPYGIGGDPSVIWHCDASADKVYELSVTDFSVIRSSASPYTWPFGIGGDPSVIWHCDTGQDRVYELSTADFSVVRSTSSPSTSPTGIGGDPSVIWHCDASADKVYELSVTDFSVVRSASSPYTFPTGIGGDPSVIWHCDNDAKLIYELSVTDFSVVRSVSNPGSVPYGIGGDSSVIWHCDYGLQKIYQLGT